MKGKIFFFIAFAMIPALTYGQAAGPDKNDDRIERLDSVVVSAYRADSKTPVAHTTVTSDALKAVEPDASLPMALSLQPSVVTMLATYWLSQSWIEEWYIWFGVNALSVWMYMQTKMYPFAVLYFFLFLIAVKGLLNWKKNGKVVKPEPKKKLK